MHRQHVTTEDIARETLTLTGPAAHHLLHVLRLREGDEVGAFDGAGATRLYHVAARTPEALTLVAKQPLFRQGERPVRLSLGQRVCAALCCTLVISIIIEFVL